MSAWIEPYKIGAQRRYRVRYRIERGGRLHYGGKFGKRADAEKRRDWIRSEIAAMRIPDIGALVDPPSKPTLAQLAPVFARSRVDVAAGTQQTYATHFGRIVSHRIAKIPVDRIEPSDVSAWVADLIEGGLARESMRKTKSTLAMLLDYAKVRPNPARDPSIKLPKDDSDEIMPPTAADVVAALRALPARYRLPHLVLDVCGVRITELELMKWKDIDEIGGRWRVRKAISKTSRSRFVPFADFPEIGALLVFDAVMALMPREDRDGEAQVFAGFKGSNYRTALGRACRVAGVPAFSPHDLRHRRATLWALNPALDRPQSAAWLGHSVIEFDKTYTHVILADRAEVDHLALLKEYGLASSARIAAVE